MKIIYAHYDPIILFWLSFSLAAHELIIITGQRHPVISFMRKMGVQVFCLEEVAGVGASKTAILLNHPETLIFLSKVSKDSLLLTFKPSLPFKKILSLKNPPKFLQNKVSLASSIENKVLVKEFAKKFEIPILKSLIVRNETDINGLDLTKEYVVQDSFGAYGASTDFTDDIKQYALKKFANKKNSTFLVTEFIRGYTITANGVTSDTGVTVSDILLQLTGDPKATPFQFGTFGTVINHPDLDIDIKQKCFDLMIKIGTALQTLEYKGFFGCDFLVVDNQIFLLEINSRFTSSFSYMSALESNSCKSNLILEHIDAFTKHKSSSEFFVIDGTYTQLTLRKQISEVDSKIYTLNQPKFMVNDILKLSLALSETLILTKSTKDLGKFDEWARITTPGYTNVSFDKLSVEGGELIETL